MSFGAPRIVIAGGGLAGLTLALALKQGRGAAIDVILADPALDAPSRGHGRAFALAAASRRMFETLGVWDEVEPTAQPITEMVITDSRAHDAVRPVFLTFAQPEEADEPFAHMIEMDRLIDALKLAARKAGVTLMATPVSGFDSGAESVAIQFQDGTSQDAALLVAADGVRSRLRELAGIGWVGWPYRQTGLTATVTHARDHEGKAFEHFMASGPFAILPLRAGGALGHRSSVVWTETSADAGNILALDAQDQLAELERRFGYRLGEIALETPLASYPLGFGVARRFAGERIALMGDAAHQVHPIAGQGLNLGLKDVASLAEGIVDACRLGLDPGGAEVLAAYEQARRADTVAMGAVMDGLNRLFSNDITPVRMIRDLGLGLVDRMPGLKRFFIAQAAGLAGEPPRLLRGEPI